MNGHLAKETEMMERIRKIFVEREEEYQKKEVLYQERKESLSRQETACEERFGQLETREEILREKEQRYREREAVLAQKEEQFQKEKEALEKEQEAKGREREETMIQISILKEEARNEKLKAQRLSEEYEKKISLFREGAMAMRKESTEEGLFSLEEQEVEMASVMEENASMKEQIRVLQEEKEALEQELERILEEIERLQKEKGELFRKLMHMEKDPITEGSETETEEQEVLTLGMEKRQEPFWESAEELEPEMVSVEEEPVMGSAEDLTAETLSVYLKEKGKECETLHSREGEMIWMSLYGLSVIVLFQETCCFDIHKKIPNNRRVKQMIAKLNVMGSPVEAAYDKEKHEVILTGHFDRQDAPSAVWEKINQTITAYFEV